LEKHLTENQFLASNQITLADIAVVVALVTPFRELFAPDYVKQFPSLTRWFQTCVNQPQFADVIGKVEFAKNEKQAAKSGGGGGGKKDKKGGEQKEEKTEEPQGKKNKDNKKPKEDKPKEDKPKKEKGKKKQQEEEPEAEAGGDMTENEKLEAKLEAERAAEAKKKNVLDELPKSHMVLDDVKRLYFKERPYYKGFWDEFWGGLWDPTGYCVYYSEYKHNDENQLSYMTGNAIGGFLQRLEKARKYMWGVLNISCKDEDTPPYYITGAWIFRGPTIPAEMLECSDSELYNWTKLDMSKPADRKVLVDEFQADDLKAGVVIDRRFCK
jgi:elongation factor 1-gamma